MPELNLCSQCGGPLRNDGALGGGCPLCMLELGFETTVGSRLRLEPGIANERPPVIGRYRILRLIGEGGAPVTGVGQYCARTCNGTADSPPIRIIFAA